MGGQSEIKVLFLDVGGVLLTNGWDHNSRRRTAERFGLDYGEMNDRHQMTFDTYERGLITMEEYLKRVVFWRTRDFTVEQFRDAMFSQSQPLTENIEMFRQLAAANDLRVGAINNEGRELNLYRIHKFGLARLIEFFISSCFVRFRKPDEGIFRLALDISQAKPEHAAYVDDREMFVEVACELGIHSIYHQDLAKTRKALGEMGLQLPAV